MSSRELSLILRLKDEASKELQGFSGKIDGMKPTFTKMAAVGTAAFTGITAVIYETTQAYQEQERYEVKLAHLLKQATGATEEQIKSLYEQASALQALGVIGNETIIALQGQLATFELSTDTIKMMTPAILDMIVAEKGVNATTEDMISFGNAFGMAMEGNYAALTKRGFKLDENTKLIIEQGTETEKAEAITRYLTNTYGGLNEAMRETSEGGMKVLKNDFGDLMKELGKAFVPLLIDLVKKINPLIIKFKEWVEENSELTKIITLVTLAISGLVAVAGVLGLLLITLTPAIGVLTGAIGLILSPIGLVIVAIGALIAIGILLWKNWDTVAAKAQEYWEKIKTIVSGALNWLKENFLLFMGPAGWITKIIIDNWEFIAEFFKDIWEKIAMTFKTAIDWIIENTINKLVNSLQRIVDIARRARDAVSGIGGKVSGAVSSVASKVGGAIGVRDAIITPQGDVIQTDPADYLIATQTPYALAGGGIVINIDKVIGSDRRTAESFANEIAKIIKHEVKY